MINQNTNQQQFIYHAHILFEIGIKSNTNKIQKFQYHTILTTPKMNISGISSQTVASIIAELTVQLQNMTKQASVLSQQLYRNSDTYYQQQILEQQHLYQQLQIYQQQQNQAMQELEAVEQQMRGLDHIGERLVDEVRELESKIQEVKGKLQQEVIKGKVGLGREQEIREEETKYKDNMKKYRYLQHKQQQLNTKIQCLQSQQPTLRNKQNSCHQSNRMGSLPPSMGCPSSNILQQTQTVQSYNVSVIKESPSSPDTLETITNRVHNLYNPHRSVDNLPVCDMELNTLKQFDFM